MRGTWAQANAALQAQLISQFQQPLPMFGFTLGGEGGGYSGGGYSGNAWADWEGKSHGEFAGEIVMGLAGSSYKSAW